MSYRYHLQMDSSAKTLYAPDWSPQPDRLRLSRSRLFALAILYGLLLLVVSVQVAAFTAKIEATPRSFQGDYIIDVYYYLELGRQIAADHGRTGQSLWDLVEQYRPNPSSTGITYLNALYAFVSGSPFVVAAIQCFLIVWVAARTWPGAVVGKTLQLVLLGGLMPYILLPSKESFVVVGYLLLLVGWFRPPRRLAPSVLGVCLIAAARPEAAVLLCAAAVLHQISRRLGWLLALLVAGGAYYLARDTLILYSTRIQEAASLTPDFFCTLGPLNVCAGDDVFEMLVLKRILVVTGLPLKWLWDWAVALPVAGLVELVIKSSLVLQLVWLWLSGHKLLRRRVRQATFRQPMIRFALAFAVIYVGAFAGVIFFQPSRQVALALCLLLVTLTISGHRRSPANIARAEA